MFLRKGFTLLELLIVIGILAILMTVVAFVLNPAQMLAQSRDSTRMSDMSTLNSAIALYLATATTTTLLNATTSCMNVSGAGSLASSSVFSTGSPTGPCYLNTTIKNDGTGWVNINFAQTPSGAPISKLPQDPLGNSVSTNFYAFKTDGTNYKIDGVLESAKYIPLMSTDGGTNASTSEIGTGISL